MGPDEIAECLSFAKSCVQLEFEAIKQTLEYNSAVATASGLAKPQNLKPLVLVCSVKNTRLGKACRACYRGYLFEKIAEFGAPKR